jgi:hypothetical protein
MAIHPFEADWSRSDGPLTTSVFDYLEGAAASVVFAYTALEAFVNEELPEEFVYEFEEETDGGALAVRQYRKPEIERRTGLSEKLATVLPRALDRPSPKGQRVWEGFVHMRRLRNHIIHMKSADRSRSNASDMYPQSIWSDLLGPEFRDFASVAKEMMLHFKSGGEPHWLANCPF